MRTADRTRRLERTSTLFKAMADRTRLRILGLLLTGEVCVCDIHTTLKIPQPKTSRHLAYLRRAGLVETRRDGQWIHYRLATVADPALATITDAVRRVLATVDVIQKDATRMRDRGSCCMPTSAQHAGNSCGPGTHRGRQ